MRLLAPGLALVLAGALVTRYLSRFLPSAVGDVLVAVLLGVLVANVPPVPGVTPSGVCFAVQRIPRLDIILLGARLSLVDVVAIGGGALGPSSA